MTILRVAVEDEQAGALKHLLEAVSFVKDVQEEVKQPTAETPSPAPALDKIKAILASANGKELFADIEDPVEWQRQLRKEWERDI